MFIIDEGRKIDVEMTDNCNIKLTDENGVFIYLNLDNREFNQCMDKMAMQMVKLGVIADKGG